MALTNKELQDILDNLTPEEQKQLYHQLSRNISNTEPTTPLQSNKHPVSKETARFIVVSSVVQSTTRKWIYKDRYATIPM